MAALAQCDAFGYIYDQAGDPSPDILVVLKRVIDAGGNPILLGPKTTVTDSAGSYHFTLPEDATAYISARASTLLNCPDGRAFKVPPGPSGELIPDFSLPASTLVEPPLVYVGDVLSIPKASETQDGYLSAADYVAFLAGGADVGITQINTGAGLTGGPITDTGTIALLPVSGVAGSWTNPTSITINAYGQIIAITATADTSAPNITVILATSVNGTTETITWHTDDLSDSQVEFGPTTAYENGATTIDATLVQDHVVTLTGLNPLSPYHYRVKSRNAPPASLLQTSPDNTFTTAAGADTTAPVITLASTPVTAISGTGATINWTTSENADSEVRYSTDTSYGTATVPPITNTPVSSAGVTTHAVTLSSLTSGTLYHYQVKSKDAAGNAAIPVTGTFNTSDVTPPVITLASTPVTGITGTAATINWTTNEAADSQVEYSTDTSYGTPTVPPIFDTPVSTAGVTTHAVALSGLTAATLYHYRVKSKDAAGNPATPVTGTFTTTAPSADLLTGLTSMWKLDETGLVTRADSHGTNALGVSGTTLSGIAGKIGNATHFTGDGSFIASADNATLRTGAIDYTVAFWVNMDSKAAAGDFVSKAGGGGTDEYIVGYDLTNDKFRYTVQGGGSYVTAYSTALGSPATGTWYFVVAWHDQTGNQINIQVNNNATIDSFTPIPPLVAGVDSFNLGAYGPATANFLHGLIDEAAFWQGRKLGSAERAALWAGGAGLPFGSWT